MGEYDLVSRREFAANCAADREGERRHIWAEDNLIGIAAQEIAHGTARPDDHLVSVATGGVGTAGVRIVGAKIIGNCGDHSLWHLRAARPIEESGGIAVYMAGKRRELGADPVEI